MIIQSSQQPRYRDLMLRAPLFFLAIFLLYSFFLCLNVYASDFIIVAVELNTEVKTDVFAFLEDNGDFLLKVVDLESMGLQAFNGRRSVIDEEQYVSLRSIQGVEFIFQEATLTLELTVDPQLLPTVIIDMYPLQKKKVYLPEENSLFLNYGLDFEGGTENGGSFRRQSFNIINELGIRRNDVLFFTDTLYRETYGDRGFVRLNTNFTYDRRDKMQRLIIGDSLAFSGDLGSRIQFAGVTLSKFYQIDPYFVEYPFYNFSGVLSLPSEIAIYSNGAKLHTEDLPPGRFDVRNFHNTGGAQDVVVEITDSMGRVQRVASPFYFSNLLLRKGLSEYSYHLGTMRRDYGLDDDRYSHAVFLGRHRYGYTDAFNLGVRTEAGNGLYNLGFDTLYSIKNYGILGFDISCSNDGDGSGWANLIRYEYRNHKFNARFTWVNSSDEYQTFERQELGKNRTSVVRFGVGYSRQKFGSISLDLARAEYLLGSDENSVFITYSKRLNRKISLNSHFRYSNNEESETEIYLSMSYYFKDDHTVTTTLRQGRDSNSQALEARSGLPVGEGGGWWGIIEREDSGSSEYYTFNPGGQWNTSYGTYRGEIDLNSDGESVRLAASGAIVSLEGQYGLTRPVTDSFGVVDVNGIEGVRVYANGQEIGKTNSQGRLFTSELTSFYHNRITIEDEDIPIDYLMPQVEKTLAPPFRSGSCLSFPVVKYQAFTGTLSGVVGGERKPLEFYEGEIFGVNKPVKFFTGSGGEFYFDNDLGSVEEPVFDSGAEGCALLSVPATAGFEPGLYEGQAISEIGDVCHFELQLPATEERYFELGEISCTSASQ